MGMVTCAISKLPIRFGEELKVFFFERTGAISHCREPFRGYTFKGGPLDGVCDDHGFYGSILFKNDAQALALDARLSANLPESLFKDNYIDRQVPFDWVFRAFTGRRYVNNPGVEKVKYIMPVFVSNRAWDALVEPLHAYALKSLKDVNEILKEIGEQPLLTDRQAAKNIMFGEYAEDFDSSIKEEDLLALLKLYFCLEFLNKNIRDGDYYIGDEFIPESKKQFKALAKFLSSELKNYK